LIATILLGYIQFQVGVNGPFLFVVPNSKVDFWEKIFRKYFPDFNAVTYAGNSSSREIIFIHEFYKNVEGAEVPKFNILLTTFDFVLKDRDYFTKIIWNYLIIDEAHLLCQYSSLVLNSLNQLQVANKLLITESILHNYKFLWPLLNFLHPNIFPSVEFLINGIAENEEKIYDLLNQHILRKYTSDIKDRINEKTLRLPISSNQASLIQMIFKGWSEEKDVQIKRNMLRKVLHQIIDICNHSSIFETKDLDDITNLSSSSKIMLLDNLLPSLIKDGKKIIIISKYYNMLNYISKHLIHMNLKFQRIDGHMKQKNRSVNSYHFNSINDCNIILLTSSIAELGIDVSSGDTIIIMDCDWDPQNFISRFYKNTYEKSLNIYRVITSKTVEEILYENIKKKVYTDRLIYKSLGMIKTQKRIYNYLNKNDIINILHSSQEQISEPENELDLDKILLNAEESKLSSDNYYKFIRNFYMNTNDLNDNSNPDKKRKREHEEETDNSKKQRIE